MSPVINICLFMTQIICLANSWKRGERCIAGIDIKTRNWIRPICDRLEFGCIPKYIRSLNGKEPQLLDVIDIPLNPHSCESGFALENKQILPGKWQKIGIVNPQNLIKVSNNNWVILHNSDRYVTVSFLKSLPFIERRTIQLTYTSQLQITKELKTDGRTKWKGTLINNFGYKLDNASITDPEFVKRLESGYQPQYPCLVTVSLSLPFRPHENWQVADPCWKLISGVIELA
jgi:hypothetical protein